MRRLFLFLFVLAFVPGFLLNQRRFHKDVYRSVCELAEQHFYQYDRSLVDWVRACIEDSSRIGMFRTTDGVLDDLRDRMSEMNASHFLIYDPVEEKRMWKGESLDTGIRSRFIEDHLIVSRVLKGTAAEAAGVRAGDEILAIEGAEQVTPWGAQRRSGRFHLARGDGELEVWLKPTVVVVEYVPELTRIDSRTALIEISSFRGEFFDHDEWLKFTGKFTGGQFEHIILDLRENSGGNFVAMLRGLSPFFCSATRIGDLLQPRKVGLESDAFGDELEDEKQIAALDRYRRLGLRTFGDYGCYSGKLTVLIGPETASVSEIFSEAVKMRPRTRVWGQPTAGDVLLAVWYDLPMLGPGYSVSIPEAIFVTTDKRTLENKGVVPQKDLFYDLKIARRGLDSWVEESRR